MRSTRIKSNIDYVFFFATLFIFIFNGRNLYNFCVKHINLDFSQAHKIVIFKIKNMLEAVHSYYEVYDFKNIIKTINKMTLELSTWYFAFIKDSLYCDVENNSASRAIQTVLFQVLKSFLTILSPIIPHATD